MSSKQRLRMRCTRTGKVVWWQETGEGGNRGRRKQTIKRLALAKQGVTHEGIMRQYVSLEKERI